MCPAPRVIGDDTNGNAFVCSTGGSGRESMLLLHVAMLHVHYLSPASSLEVDTQSHG